MQEIVDYLDNDEVIFPIRSSSRLPSTVRFVASRGPKPTNASEDAAGCTGTLEIPLPVGNEPKPGWIVDGQQRTLALGKARRQDLPVLVTAFVADNIDVQRDQFLRINNTKPLPRGLVTELLPSISSPLPPRLAIKQAPSKALRLAEHPRAVRRPDSPLLHPEGRSGDAVITDTRIVAMLTESLTSPVGCLYPYRNPSSGETDF